MRKRITIAQLRAKVGYLNRLCGTPETSYTRGDNGRLTANIGNYHISQSYGGYDLHQMMNDCGGVRSVLSCGHIPARELLGKIDAYICGIVDKE